MTWTAHTGRIYFMSKSGEYFWYDIMGAETSDSSRDNPNLAMTKDSSRDNPNLAMTKDNSRDNPESFFDKG